MSWADCGTDKNDRKIGYMHDATCDQDGCDEKINRGLSFACGDMHGETEFGCEKYFCQEHLSYVVDDDNRFFNICSSCKKELIESGEWIESEDSGDLIRVKE